MSKGMAKAGKPSAPENKVVRVADPTQLAGSSSEAWTHVLVNQTLNCLWTKHSNAEQCGQQLDGAIDALMGIGSSDVLEGMLAGQMIAAHNAAMECFRRAMLAEQSLEGRNMNLSQANKLSRTYAALLEALNRHRGKGQQKMTVEHVHVHAGGQAVVGVVNRGGSASPKDDGQPHAPGETLLGQIEAEREALPSACGSRL
jgi:hypothetical protein